MKFQIMRKFKVDQCFACDPLNRVLNELLESGFHIVEEKLQDYHFHQLYYLMEGDLSTINKIDTTGFQVVEGKLICDCHWSTIELK